MPPGTVAWSLTTNLAYDPGREIACQLISQVPFPRVIPAGEPKYHTGYECAAFIIFTMETSKKTDLFSFNKSGFSCRSFDSSSNRELG